jgi:formylglycine-generating enzyme required for sulfatase activity
MKLLLASFFLVGSSTIFALAQNAPAPAPLNRAAPIKLQGAPAPAAAKSNTAPAAVTATNPPAADVVTNKPDIKELLKENSFTNSSSMVMVKISSTLWAGKYLVTQEEYQKVMGSNPSQFRGEKNPVDSVSWSDAVGFCARLTDIETKETMLPDGAYYTLPTQAQWESWAASTSLDAAVTSQNGSRSGTSAVGSLKANAVGLYDVRGNVWEWCLDPQDKPFRVLRGGAWDTSLDVNLRPEFRWYSPPDERKNTFGFRCVMVVEAK